jgi:predicted transcriptional regulator YdeE
MKVVRFDEKKIVGIKIRTKNSNEMNPETAKIGKLWDSFIPSVTPHMSQNSQVYGVYYNYESDMNGEFDVLAGANDLVVEPQLKLDDISIAGGNYLVFSSKGSMPQAVIEAWVLVWNYFSSNDCNHTRTYKTDFEHYKTQNEVDVYIGIQD